MRRVLASAALAACIAACGGSDRVGVDNLKTKFVESGAVPADQAECVAEHIAEAGLSQDELREFLEYDEGEQLPSRNDVYTEGRGLCDDF